MVDALTAGLTYSMQKGSQNIRALFLHNLSDALASVAVIVGGTLIILYDMRWVDPAITIGIAIYILYLAFTEIGGPVRTLMLGSPPDIDGEQVVAALRRANGVQRRAPCAPVADGRKCAGARCPCRGRRRGMGPVGTDQGRAKDADWCRIWDQSLHSGV